MATPHPDPETRAADRREEILQVLRTSAEPQTVADLAEALGLKPSTIRGHLDVLLATGSVDRDTVPSPGRGRPQWAYRAAIARTTPYELLARALAHHLEGGPTPPDVLAEEWLARVPEHTTAQSPDEAVGLAVQALDSLGFAAEVSPLGDSIAMTRCPYAELVEDFPLICDIHGALLRHVIEDSDQGVTVERVDVWAREGMCIARLHRPDLAPERIITSAEIARMTVSAAHGKDRPR